MARVGVDIVCDVTGTMRLRSPTTISQVIVQQTGPPPAQVISPHAAIQVELSVVACAIPPYPGPSRAEWSVFNVAEERRSIGADLGDLAIGIGEFDTLA